MTQALISKLIRLEQDGPLTLNEHYLADYKDKFLSYYKGARERNRNPTLAKAIASVMPATAIASFMLPTPDDGDQSYDEEPPAPIARILSNLASIGLDAVRPEDLAKLLAPDKMDPALNIMADVRAYFQGKGNFLLYFRAI